MTSAHESSAGAGPRDRSRLDAADRPLRLAAATAGSVDVLVCRRRRHRCGMCTRCREPRVVRRRARGGRHRLRHLLPLGQDLPRRPPVSRATQFQPGAPRHRRARPDGPHSRPLHLPTGALPLPAHQALGAAVRRCRHPALRHLRPARQSRSAAATLHPARRRTGGAVAGRRRGHRRDPVLRRADGRCPAHHGRAADGGGLRRPRSDQGEGGGLPEVRRPDHRRGVRRRAHRQQARGHGEGRGERGGCLVERTAETGRCQQLLGRARQGCAPGTPQRRHRFPNRHSRQGVGFHHHRPAVAGALAGWHHRHALGRFEGAPRSQRSPTSSTCCANSTAT